MTSNSVIYLSYVLVLFNALDLSLYLWLINKANERQLAVFYCIVAQIVVKKIKLWNKIFAINPHNNNNN